MDRTRLERRVHAAVNETRERHGRRGVAYDPDLRPVARYHSRRMVAKGELFHEAPDGEDLSERLDMFDYDLIAKGTGQRFCHDCSSDLRRFAAPAYCPACGTATLDSTLESTRAGENLAVKRYVPRPVGTDEETAATAVVDGWLESPGHRDNLLEPSFEREAIGVVVTDERQRVCVYVTQVLS
ncbi:CAP domain-containing protein [Halobaculum sp. MBLA0147]|uniref:CAP domain-containing protein n=1 Tax=Halobaculum sp. MBLA0147 TaxID=3079934 RepID=UPI00352561CF